MAKVMEWIRASWKAFMPILIAALWTLGSEFVDAIAANYDGAQTWILGVLSAVAVWLKRNAPNPS